MRKLSAVLAMAILLMVLLPWTWSQASARDKDRQHMLKAKASPTNVLLSWHEVDGHFFRLLRFDKANEREPDPEPSFVRKLAPGQKEYYDIDRINVGAIIKYRLEVYSKEGIMTTAHLVTVEIPDPRDMDRPGKGGGTEEAA